MSVSNSNANRTFSNRNSSSAPATESTVQCTESTCDTMIENFPPDTFSAQTMRAFDEMRENGQLVDVILVADDGVEMAAHATVLAFCSSYFRTAFATGSIDKRENKMKVSGVPSFTLRQIIDYAYTRTVDEGDTEDVRMLLAWADFFNMTDLVRFCCQLLSHRLTARNCLSIHRLMKWYSFPDLAEAALAFALKNFDTVAIVSKDLMKDSVEDLTDLLSNDRLNAADETTVWRTVERWLGQDPKSRCVYAGRLLKHVRLCLLNEQALLEVVSSEYVDGNAECMEFVKLAYQYLSKVPLKADNFLSMVEHQTFTPRLPDQLLFALGGWSRGAPTSIIETYDRKTNVWAQMRINDPKGPRAYHGCVLKDGELYAIGGFNGRAYFNSMRRFDFASKTWLECSPMHQSRCYVSTAVHKGYIWAMGGFDGRQRMSSAERYDFQENQWTMLAPLNNTRSDAHATVCSDRVFITGGFNGSDCLDSVEQYDALMNQWAVCAPMKHRRSGLGCITLDNVMYVVGGFNGHIRQKSSERYDPRVGRWEDLPEMHTSRSNFGIECLNGNIMVVGGFNGEMATNECEWYEPRMNVWTRTASMTVNRSALFCVTVDWLPNIREFLSASEFATGQQLPGHM